MAGDDHPLDRHVRGLGHLPFDLRHDRLELLLCPTPDLVPLLLTWDIYRCRNQRPDWWDVLHLHGRMQDPNDVQGSPPIARLRERPAERLSGFRRTVNTDDDRHVRKDTSTRRNFTPGSLASAVHQLTDSLRE